MRETKAEQLNQTLYTERLDNGLTVFLLPKPGYSQTYAAFSTNYGSNDSVFRLAGESEFREVPDGIAHFLEHKMFESESGDVFPEFARHGASANAFTTFDMTTYLFSSTEDLAQNVNTLLDFVQDPYFTEESVEKEKGIIGQEIRMYDDNPEWRAFFGLLRALYAKHPVRIDIAGTVESIAKIDKDTLYRCYNTFYHPSNMAFCAVGGFDVEQMMQVIRDNQAKKTFSPPPEIERKYPDEPKASFDKRVTATLSVSQPRCLIGWKDEQVGLRGHALLEQELLTGVILDTLFGRGSPLFDKLIEENLIDQSFSWEYECTPTYGYALVGGNSSDPERLVAEVNRTLQQAQSEGIPTEEFERCRKKAAGRFVSSLDSPSHIARSFVSYYFKDADFFASLNVLESLTRDKANHRLQTGFQSEQQSMSVVQGNDK